jgi:peptide/nickel transport system ATP-binding protein
MTPEIVLSIRNLRISISTDEGPAKILDRVQFDLPRGQVVGIAGESGCGKSTLIRAILGILPRQARVESGEILFENLDLLKLSQREMQRRLRGRAIGFIPQDPYLALNPVFTVGTQLMEILRWHGLPDEEEAASWRVRRARHRQRLIDLLRAVQMPSPEDALDRYPHEFSGGQR